MDLRPIELAANDAERAAVDALLGPADAHIDDPVALADARAKRHLLLPALHALQARIGWISPAALGYVSRRLAIAPAEAYGVASFYALFALARAPEAVVHVCDDIACQIAGADALCSAVAAKLGPERANRDGRGWQRSPCLGLCEHAPAAMLTVAGEVPHAASFGHATVDAIARALERRHADDDAHVAIPQAGSDALRLLRRVGRVDPTSLDAYRAHDGYAALRRALDIGPAGVVREVTDSKLVGRGGAAFPTGRKWDAVARQPVRPHYLVCNADESEPGTFKDRVLMEEDPFAIVEAMTIAGYATGCEKGFLYIRGEYPLAMRRIDHAIATARARGFLGDDVLGRGVRFDIEVRRGAGAYICGEETALFNSLEGKRGEPRNKPPYPVEVGLFGKPTLVNNVETLASVLEVLRLGAADYASIGTAGSTGTKLFCLSGSIAKPGLFEAPYGTRLDALIAMAGGVRDGRSIRTVLLGGAAGTFLTERELSIPLTFEDTRAAGASLGSGVVMVFDDTVPMVPVLRRIAAFFRDESCGQCVPCRVGTVRQEESIARIATGRARGGDASEHTLLRDVGQAMRDASICGLGQTASMAIESALARGLFDAKGAGR